MRQKIGRLSQFFRRTQHDTIFGPQTFFHIFVNTTKVVFFIHLFTEYVGEVRVTWGPSMLPTLSAKGDAVYVSKLFRRGKYVHVGDVVSLRHPMDVGTGAIKRIVGMPGDFVLRDMPGSRTGDMIQVPEGHCWIIGDNLPWSRDSRIYGPLPLALIKGKVLARLWPLQQMGWIKNNLQAVEAE